MQDVPVGANIPVVIQTGKWRRQITLPMVTACRDNVFSGAETFRLPKNQSEGHLPKIAMTRGGADSLECVLRRIGISDTEFTNPDGTGRVNIYYETGGGTGYTSGAAFPPVSTLFNQTVINKYDMVVISCHGKSAMSRAQPVGEKQIVKNFVDAGGRVFGSHFSFGYFRGVAGTTDAKNFQPTPWPLLAMWDGGSDAPFTVDTSFAKGAAFADWLVAVGASTTRGQITLTSVESPAMSLTPGFGSQRWINTSDGIPYFSVPMPVERAATPAEQCGRFVHTGIHVAASGNGSAFPTGCGTAALSPQEKAWEFLIFELSACALPDNQSRRPRGSAARRAQLAAAVGDPAARAAATAAAAAAADDRLGAVPNSRQERVPDPIPSSSSSSSSSPSSSPNAARGGCFKSTHFAPAPIRFACSVTRGSTSTNARSSSWPQLSESRRGCLVVKPPWPIRSSSRDVDSAEHR